MIAKDNHIEKIAEANNALTAIVAFTDLALEGERLTVKDLKIIRQQAARIKGLLKDVAGAETEAGKPLSNQRQENYCQNVVSGFSQKEAYIRAGYKSKGQAAEANAARLIRNDRVSERINYLRKQAGKKAGISRGKILNLLNNMLNADIVEITAKLNEGQPISTHKTDNTPGP